MDVNLSTTLVYPQRQPTNPTQGKKADQESGGPSNGQAASTTQNSEEARQIETLRARDREVRAHEQAHLAAAGRFATSGANFQYQRGPDGKRYAVAGDVKIDTSPVHGDPKATEQKAETIHRAALAPVNPSAQDRRVAAEASNMAYQARLEILSEKNTTQKDPTTTETPSGGNSTTGTEQLHQRLLNSGALTSINSAGVVDLFS